MKIADLNGWAQELVRGAAYKEYSRDSKSLVYLRQYHLPDGRKYFEFVQGETVTKDGIIIFPALKDENGQVVAQSLWSENVINHK